MVQVTKKMVKYFLECDAGHSFRKTATGAEPGIFSICVHFYKKFTFIGEPWGTMKLSIWLRRTSLLWWYTDFVHNCLGHMLTPEPFSTLFIRRAKVRLSRHKTLNLILTIPKHILEKDLETESAGPCPSSGSSHLPWDVCPKPPEWRFHQQRKDSVGIELGHQLSL